MMILRPAARGPGTGTVAIEAALILPLLVLLFTALFDIGVAAYESMRVQAAAEAGAQYAAKYTWDPDAVAAIVAGASGHDPIAADPAPVQFCGCPTGGTLATLACGATCTDGTRPSVYARVSASVTHFTVLDYPALPKPLTLTAQAITRLQ
jgi:Flp pilus assembly protein TadG